MAGIAHENWKRFKQAAAKGGHDTKAFSDSFGTQLDKVDKGVEDLENQKKKLHGEIVAAQKTAEKYQGLIEDLIRACARDEAKKKSAYDLRGILHLLEAYLKTVADTYK